MKVVNKVIPNKEQIMGFLEPGPDGPICIVNLLKFKPLAEYDDGRSTELTGREAYEVYEQGVKKLLKDTNPWIRGGAVSVLTVMYAPKGKPEKSPTAPEITPELKKVMDLVASMRDDPHPAVQASLGAFFKNIRVENAFVHKILIAQAAALEGIKLLTDFAPAHTDHLIHIDTDTMRMHKLRVRRNPACPHCGSMPDEGIAIRE